MYKSGDSQAKAKKRHGEKPAKWAKAAGWAQISVSASKPEVRRIAIGAATITSSLTL